MKYNARLYSYIKMVIRKKKIIPFSAGDQQRTFQKTGHGSCSYSAALGHSYVKRNSNVPTYSENERHRQGHGVRAGHVRVAASVRSS